MAKETEVSCDFMGKQLVCMLPNQTMDVLLKVCTKTGGCIYTFIEVQNVEQSAQTFSFIKEKGSKHF